MICPKCGAQNMDGVLFCGSCGAQMASQTPPLPEEPQHWQPGYGNRTAGGSYQGANSPYGNPSNGGMVPPKNYMTEAILVTVISLLCCCSLISVVLGIIAIVKANNVNPAFAGGNYNEAISNADSAKNLTIWAAVIAVVFSIIITIVYALCFAAEFGGLLNLFDM